MVDIGDAKVNDPQLEKAEMATRGVNEEAKSQETNIEDLHTEHRPNIHKNGLVTERVSETGVAEEETNAGGVQEEDRVKESDPSEVLDEKANCDTIFDQGVMDPKGSCQKRFSGIRPLRGYPPPP